MTGRERRVHQGVGFDLWTAEYSWFWKLADRGAIGAALSHGQAITEACMAIEELDESVSRRDTQAACTGYGKGWYCALDRLAGYVAAI